MGEFRAKLNLFAVRRRVRQKMELPANRKQTISTGNMKLNTGPMLSDSFNPQHFAESCIGQNDMPDFALISSALRLFNSGIAAEWSSKSSSARFPTSFFPL